MKIVTVVGARPQFVKAAIVSKELKNHNNIEEILIHTGQHFDHNMSDVFFSELELKNPNLNLRIQEKSPSKQLSKMIDALSDSLKKEKPEATMVYGDTNSTLATAIVSNQLNIPLIHVEGGERIYRRKNVPEEINRILTDHSSVKILTSTKRALKFLEREGLGIRSMFVGDPLYDLFLWGLKRQTLNKKNIVEDFNLEENNFILATLHRAENTSNKNILLGLLNTLDECDYKVVLPVHPRIKNILKESNYKPKKNLKLIDPLGYIDFQRLLISAKKVFTDSGGVTREAYFSKKMCIVPMFNSWWTEIVESGWCIEVGRDFEVIKMALNRSEPSEKFVENIFGDGNSKKLIVDELNLISLKESKNLDSFPWHKNGTIKDLPKVRNNNFSYSNYEFMIQKFIDSGYSFEFFGDAEKNINENKSFVLLRHDIDMSIEKALKIAEIEKNLGVKSTYFFLLRNDFYNIFSKRATNLIKKILSFGHELGLHFDTDSYVDLDINKINFECKKEALILGNWFNKKVNTISFHRPNDFILSGDPLLTYPLLHSYMPLFSSEIKYMSDSKGIWNNGNPLDSDSFKNQKPIQILTHPIWWNEKSIDTYQNLLDFLDIESKNSEVNLSNYCKTFRFGRYYRK